MKKNNGRGGREAKQRGGGLLTFFPWKGGGGGLIKGRGLILEGGGCLIEDWREYISFVLFPQASKPSKNFNISKMV